MSKDLKIMVFWSFGFPVITMALIMITDFVLGRGIELFSYLAIFLGIAAGGLMFAGPLNYLIFKSQGK